MTSGWAAGKEVGAPGSVGGCGNLPGSSSWLEQDVAGPLSPCWYPGVTGSEGVVVEGISNSEGAAMARAYGKLVEVFQRLAQLDHALTFLQWDQMVMMPPRGNEARASAIAELVALHHELLTGSAMADLLAKAAEQETEPLLLRSIMEMKRTWQQAVCVPGRLVKAKSLAGTRCEHGWRRQRQENDWVGFLANFKEVVALSREEAQARQAAAPNRFATAYDALLDLYCTGDSASFISHVFTRLKEELPDILSAVLNHQSSAPTLYGHYPVAVQEQLNRRLMGCLGFDFSAGRLDVSSHPFSTGDRGDQRITTRFRDNEFIEALLATAHETGHASYENGLPEKLAGLPVGEARNMCLHESQSLLFEKQIFLSKPFFQFFVAEIHAAFPDTTDLDAEAMYMACTRVQPSLIRVESDEVTYPMHVILRFEIERDLMNGGLDPEDIPEVWDLKMQKYLGLSTKGNYRDGCLQDIHWTDGAFGYFPSYTLGAINSAQLFATIKDQHHDWQERLAAGEVEFIRAWLNKRIWQQASTQDSQSIIGSATGDSTNPQYLLDHLRQRYLT